MARVELKNEYAAEEVKELILDVGYAELLVQETDTDKITVSVMRNEEKTASYRCDLENGMLKVNPGNVDIHISVFGGDKSFKKEELEKDYVLITIPCNKQFEGVELSIGAGKAKMKNASSTYRRAKIEVGAGSVSVDNLQVNGHVDVESGAGSVELLDFKSTSLDIECGVGKMKLKGSVEGNINMSCGVGTIELDLDAVESDYNYNISCAVGTVLVNGSKRGGLFANQSIMRNADAKGKINMNCGVGKIELLTRKRLTNIVNISTN